MKNAHFNGFTEDNSMHFDVTISTSENVDISDSELVFHKKKPKLKIKYMFTDWTAMMLLLCGSNGKLTMKDLQVFAAVCTFVQPKTTKAMFTRKALMNRLPVPISKAQLSISLKHLVAADVLTIDSEDVYNVNPLYTFNGEISAYQKAGLIP